MKKHLLYPFLLLAAVFCLISYGPDAHAATQVQMKLGEIRKAPGNGTFKSSNPDVIAVTKDGLHARKAGTSIVTSGNYTYNIKVKKQGMVYPVFSMMKGEKLTPAFSDSSKIVSCTSSDKKVATIGKNGKIRAKKEGTAAISIKTTEHNYLCSLTVTKKIKSVIYLTFDDGPNRYSTPKVLKILKDNNVKATFFELKPAKADFDLTKRVISEGHTLALHGYQHSYDVIYQSEAKYHANLDKLRNLFFKKFGVWCTLSRFPGGSSNTVSRYNPGIMTRLSKKVGTWGYKYFDWNVSSSDAGGAKNAKQVYHSVIRGLQKNRGNVVLMHDFANNDKTINALNRIIRYGKKHGYTFRPLSASTEEVHHGVNN